MIESLIKIIDQGISAQVVFRDGTILKDFWPHDIITRRGAQPDVVVVRGVISQVSEGPEDRAIPLCDVCGVFSTKSWSTSKPNPAASRIKPAPRGWAIIHQFSLE